MINTEKEEEDVNKLSKDNNNNSDSNLLYHDQLQQQEQEQQQEDIEYEFKAYVGEDIQSSIPKFDLEVKSNIFTWCSMRLVLHNFGERMKLRVDSYLGIKLFLILYFLFSILFLMIYIYFFSCNFMFYVYIND